MALNLNTVQAWHQSGDFAAAKKGYLQLLQKKPHDIEILHSLGLVCAQLDDFAEAIEHLELAVKLQPQNVLFKLHLANVLKLQGLFSQAAVVLQAALLDEPDYLPALNNLGTVFYAQGKLDDAIDCYQQTIAKESHYIDAYYNLGLALTKKNDIPHAIKIYQQLLDLSPEHFAARFHLGCLYMQQNEIDQAIQTFLKVEANHFETQSNLATCYLTLGKLNEAKLHYLHALELTPNDLQILFNLGVINMQQGHIDFAIQYYQRATQINPNDFASQNNLAGAFLAKQHLGFAMQHFREALRIQPANKAIQHTLDILSQHQHLLTSPPDYVKSLFDAYADHYDPHLLQALDYKLPEQIFAALSPFISSHHNLDILDFGCGTGLCSVALKPWAKTLTGVDLSPKMLDVARQKNIFDVIIEADVTDYLKEKNNAFDLIVAGDVLVYMGDLAETFKNIHAALKENGLFIFNTEISTEDDFKMNQSGRFTHQKTYLEKLATDLKMQVLVYQTVTTRLQNNEPVSGHLFVLRRI